MRTAPLIAGLALAAALLVAPGQVSAVVELGQPVRLSGAGAVPGTAGISQHRVTTALDGYAVAAWLEAVDGGSDQLMARTRAPGGAWSEAVQVSATDTFYANASVATFSLASNAAGDAALAWRQLDSFENDPENMVFAATLGRGDSTWARARVGGQQHGVSTFMTPSTGVLPDGTAVVGWTGNVDEEKAREQVYATVGGPGGWETPTQISDMGNVPLLCTEGETNCRRGDAGSLVLAVDGAGEIQARMTGEARVSNGSGGTTGRQWILANSRPAGGSWSFATPITEVQDPYVAPSPRVVVGDRTGAGFVSAWGVPATDSAPGGVHVALGEVSRTYRHDTGTYGLTGLALVGGRAAAMLIRTENSVSHLGVVHLEPGGDTWSEPSDPAVGENLSSPTASLGLHPDGRVTVAWGRGIPRRIYVTQRPPGAAAWDDPRRVTMSEASQALPSFGVAENGGGTVVWRESVDGVPAVFAAAFAPEQADPEPPSLTMTSPTAPLTRSPSWTVAWETTDRGGGIGDLEVGESVTRWDEAPDTTMTVTGYGPDDTSYTTAVDPEQGAGLTHCYAARGYADPPALPGPWSAPRCTTTPVDDRTLTRVGQDWTRKTGDGRWDRTYLQTRTKGARLRLDGVHAGVLGVLVERGQGFGRIAVSFDGVRIGTVDLAGQPRRRMVVTLAEFETAQEGSLVIKVLTRNRTVRIDGVYAAQPNDAAFAE